MIQIENYEVVGWEHAVRGMRNPMNSWEKSDSDCGWLFGTNCCSLGDNDRKLMMRLRNAGTDHRKFMRMIVVYADITAPLYWVAEHDTYKVGTVRNSCSFMHKGVSKPFNIKDFSVSDERIYEILSPLPKKHYELKYAYETDEYKTYTTSNGREYKVYKNGKIVSCAFSYTDNYGSGRTRCFPEREVKPSENSNGYYELKLGGRNGEKWLLHRLVAHVWLENKNNFYTVNHIDGDKGNNCIENLEWCTLEENIRKGFADGLYDSGRLHASYIKWKNGHVNIDPLKKTCLIRDKENGLTYGELSDKYELSKTQINNILCQKTSVYNDLFLMCYEYEKTIGILNTLREEYLDSKDDKIFEQIRQMLPSGYNVKYTWMANYEVLANIYKSRKNHRLSEWRDFCKWIETLPYGELITGEENGNTE